jgi:hypothetical protein
MRDSMMVNGPVLATVVTRVKQDNGEVEWRCGMDPVMFSTRDLAQASRGTEKLFRRVPDTYFDKTTLEEMKAKEEKIKEYIGERLGT